MVVFAITKPIKPLDNRPILKEARTMDLELTLVQKDSQNNVISEMVLYTCDFRHMDDNDCCDLSNIIIAQDKAIEAISINYGSDNLHLYLDEKELLHGQVSSKEELIQLIKEMYCE